MAAGAGAFAWATFPAMPTRRVYCSAAHRDGQLFVLGGCGGGGRALGTAELLDLQAQRWTTLPPLPTPRAGAAVLTLGKQILVVGGVDAAQSPLASVEVYHVDEGKWEKKAALAQPSMGISAVQRDGVVYALGGMGADTSPQALVRVYEPAKDHWQPLPSMPTPCYGASAFLQGNKIFILGGRQGKLPVTAFEAFDLETRSWTRYPSVPSRRAFAACAMADGVVFSLGGLQQPGPHNFYSRPHFVNTVEMFDPAQGELHVSGCVEKAKPHHPYEREESRLRGWMPGRKSGGCGWPWEPVLPTGLSGRVQPLAEKVGAAAPHAHWPLLLLQLPNTQPALHHRRCGPGSQWRCRGSVPA
nr:kelch domain-containing protein 8B isoform X3 [Taeniopygia guttata]XP_041574768.1 kelch domain-containing protein 8B isoform X3 [Taeniopygia guttata]XP_041574769.1 kelch domain-containing protein 8B isoform X3 [Taeniopygia guttata]